MKSGVSLEKHIRAARRLFGVELSEDFLRKILWEIERDQNERNTTFQYALARVIGAKNLGRVEGIACTHVMQAIPRYDRDGIILEMQIARESQRSRAPQHATR